MSYIVVHKNPPGPEMHVLKNGNMSLFGQPRRFMSKEMAKEVAAFWAQHLVDNDHRGTIVVRKV
jgi:hypothetical protein